MERSAAALQVREIASFHVGGREVELAGLPPREFRVAVGGPASTLDPNGQVHAWQMYVQSVRLAAPRFAMPLLLWHGGGLTGACWETTPDGRPGWQMAFLRAGWDVYTSDAVERGRASFAPWPEVYADAPLWRTKEHAWDIFRFGPRGGWDRDPARRRFHPGLLFPSEAVDALAMQAVPRFMCNEAETEAAYAALLRRVGPCVVVVHSQSGHFGHAAALARPDLVKALVLLEPSSAPDPETADAAAAARVPHLYVWGDFLDGDAYWARYIERVERWRGALRAAGGRAERWDLPRLGIAGNSHMLMMDRNSDAIAARVQTWLEGLGLERPSAPRPADAKDAS